MIIRPLTRPLTSPLARGITDAGVGLAWAAALPALREFITANYDQPNPHNQAVMASPPTVTAASGVQASVPNNYLYQNASAAISYNGGANQASSTFRVFPVSTIGTTGGHFGDGKLGVTWRASTRANAQVVGVRVGGGNTPYRFIVDGRYVDLTGSLPDNTSTPRYFLLDFGTKAERVVTVEGEAAFSFDGFAVGASDTCAAVGAATTKRMIVLGDSFTVGTGATRKGDTFSRVCGDALGFADLWSSGTGGTGYVATNGGEAYALTQRLGDANNHGPWDVIVVAMGLNDIGTADATVTAAVSTCLSSLRSNNPAAQIFVLGPWDKLAPAAPQAGYAATKAAIQAGIPVGSGITFLDTEGVAYTNMDGVHPDVAGHKTLGDWLALQIKTALGA